ncbi:MAG: calcium/sodium antiporter [Rhodobacteraceae bacterium]|nr:calcium/sodium antiporter [Paracoccaceae bacterium]
MHELESYQLGIIALGAIAFGVYLLIKGGDWTIDNAVAVAEKSGLSKLFIAATIVAFGTSAPELFTSVNANLSDYPGISVGNVIGSNIANVMLVVAVSAIIAPIVVDRSEVRVDTMVMIGATAAMVAGILYGLIPRWGGVAMVASIVLYILYQYRASKLDADEVEGSDEEGWKVWTMLTVGLVTLLIGSEILVEGAVAGGISLGVPEAVIGMTMIAFGTSLPELTACVAAARRSQFDIIVGGILGSNIFNILSVMAFSAIAKPLIIDERFVAFDMPIVVGVTMLFAALLVLGGKIGRSAGILMLVGYVTFIASQYLT